jgi:hypothetical protein
MRRVLLFVIDRIPGLGLVAKLRPDLDEEELNFVELEKLKKLVNSERSDDVFSLEPPIIEEPFWSAPARPVKQSKRPVRVRPHLIHLRKPRNDLISAA